MKTVRKVGFMMAGILFVVSFAMIFVALSTGLIPLKYCIALMIILGIIPPLVVFMQANKKTGILGSGIAFLLTIALLLGTYYIHRANKTLEEVAGSKVEVSVVNVYAGANDMTSSIKEAVDKAYRFGYIREGENGLAGQTINDINNSYNININTVEFDSVFDMAEAFDDGDIQAMITGSAYLALLDDEPEYAGYKDKLKILMANEIETAVGEGSVIESAGIDKDHFIVFISGIDTEGKVSTTSRSDVNILAVVNNITKTVLLISTPRDFYVPLSVSNGKKDKLTHAGVHGIDCSMDTLAMLYNEEVSYYAKMNFTGFKNVIDALGGIDVESPAAFYSLGNEYHFDEGMNHLDGGAALAFARERGNVSGGDRGRGRDQMLIIDAVLHKMMSKEMLLNYENIMKSVEGSVETSMDKEEIAYLVQCQLDSSSEWTILKYRVNGSDSENFCYTTGNDMLLYVMEPDADTVDFGKDLIDKVIQGQEVTQNSIDIFMMDHNY